MTLRRRNRRSLLRAPVDLRRRPRRDGRANRASPPRLHVELLLPLPLPRRLPLPIPRLPIRDLPRGGVVRGVERPDPASPSPPRAAAAPTPRRGIRPAITPPKRVHRRFQPLQVTRRRYPRPRAGRSRAVAHRRAQRGVPVDPRVGIVRIVRVDVLVGPRPRNARRRPRPRPLQRLSKRRSRIERGFQPRRRRVRVPRRPHRRHRRAGVDVIHRAHLFRSPRG